ncbi:Rab GDP-dissociation inhibitor [Aureococcus anophagefferens]|nr:Rab GDP-dissociation inhibitor [Aureococcus anophagefferens]
MALAAPPTTRALRRVVVTGIGCVSPVGATAPETWAGVLAGASNARRLTFGGREYLAAPAHEGAAIPRARDRSRFINLAVAAAAEAAADAGLAALAAAPSGAASAKLSPYFVPRLLANMAAGAVAVDHGCRGPLTTSAAACAAGAMSIGEAYRLIEAGRADVVLCGGAESTVDEAAPRASRRQ